MLAFPVILLALSCIARSRSTVHAAVAVVSVTVDAEHPLAYTSPNYVSVNFDWHLDAEEYPAWVNSSVMNMSLLGDLDLLYLAGQLSPAHLRVGGSEADEVIFSASQPCPPNTTFCLTGDRWTEINAFAKAANLSLAFGLNGMYGRPRGTGPWDPSNAASLLAYTAAQLAQDPQGAFSALDVLEFGNEKQGVVNANVYAADIAVLSALVNSTWAKAGVAGPTPKLVANDENPDAKYWGTLLPAAGHLLHAATWHLYIGYGLDPTLPSHAWQSTWLVPNIEKTSTPMIEVATVNTSFVSQGGKIWIGETAMAWHSGGLGVTNTYLSGPWYIAQLGVLAATHSVQCRQTLKGGNYELVDKWTHQPNPDYWTALLWKRTMGTGVLPVSIGGGITDLLVYAHCSAPWSRPQGNQAPGMGLALAWVNLNNETTYELDLAGVPYGTTTPRWEFHLTPADGNETSQQVLLNGVLLTYGGAPGASPPGTGLAQTPPKVVDDANEPILLAPHTYGYLVFPDVPNACTE